MIERKQLVGIVGAANVSSDKARLDEFSHDVSFVNPITPVNVVRASDAAEIKKLVKLANETRTPLVPVSSGAPHFRGDTVPGIGGAVVVDLSGMKKIINVDRARRVAMVEPGVTFGELIPAAAKEGIRLNMPLLPKKSKTVVASLLEREPVLMPKYQWDISDPLACVEVIFGNGEEFRTGQAAGPGSIEEQWAVGGVQKAPYGPGVTSWHRLVQGAQGTMGIVTWASMRCELVPDLEEAFVVGSSNLNSLMDMAAWLIRLRMVNECFILNNTNLAAILAKRSKDYQALKNTLPPWVLFYNVAGYEVLPEERVSSNIEDITGITQRLGLEARKAAGDISANEILKTVQQPSAEPYWKLRYKGSCEDIFFLTINDKVEGLINTMKSAAGKAEYPISDIGIYLQPIVQGTGMHCEFNLFYNPEDASETRRVRNLSTSATRSLLDGGAFFSRPYGENTSLILNRDAATVEVLNTLKNIFDPNHVMNPGKICW
jgi:FAD/FMN-containing dehydrogenase